MASRRYVWSIALLAGLFGSVYFGHTAGFVSAPGDFQDLSMQVAGQQRTYVMIRPAAQGPLPTVIFLHGLHGNADKIRLTGIGQLGAREGFVTVLPNAIDGMWSIFPPGVHYPVPSYSYQPQGGDDTTFLKHLVEDLVARGIADPNRVYLGGVSYGGFMTLRMACVAPELFAAIGVVLASMPAPDAPTCKLSKPLPLVMINGTADQVVPYAGGKTQAGFGVWGTDRTLSFFRQLNGCGDTAQRSNLPPSQWTPPVAVYKWTGCSGAPVSLYSVIGGGHRAPGAEGHVPGGFSTAETIWDFFRDKTAKIN